MSSPQLRRQDRLLADAEARELIARAYCGRLATVSADGSPYIVPLLHVFPADELMVHNAAARGHLRQNVERDARVCYEVDEPVKVFDYGRFFDALLTKYGTGTPGRPKGFYPRLDEVTVYAIAVERIAGKHCPLPPLAEQWPALGPTTPPKARP